MIGLCILMIHARNFAQSQEKKLSKLWERYLAAFLSNSSQFESFDIFACYFTYIFLKKICDGKSKVSSSFHTLSVCQIPCVYHQSHNSPKHFPHSSHYNKHHYSWVGPSMFLLLKNVLVKITITFYYKGTLNIVPACCSKAAVATQIKFANVGRFSWLVVSISAIVSCPTDPVDIIPEIQHNCSSKGMVHNLIFFKDK